MDWPELDITFSASELLQAGLIDDANLQSSFPVQQQTPIHGDNTFPDNCCLHAQASENAHTIGVHQTSALADLPHINTDALVSAQAQQLGPQEGFSRAQCPPSRTPAVNREHQK